MIRAFIVDDEPGARRLLRHLLEPHQHKIQITGEAATRTDAIRKIGQVKPDLVFLDIQLPDGTGFDILKELAVQPDVIFTTAFETYAVQAFESFSVDYLLKPIRPEKLDASLQKLEAFGKRTSLPASIPLEALAEAIRNPGVPTAFPLKTGDRILLIRFEDISHFEADDKYVFLFTLDGRKFLADQTLSSLEASLPPGFLRVQKSYLINQEAVNQIQKHFNGRFILQLKDRKQTRIRSGLTYYEKIRSVFGI